MTQHTNPVPVTDELEEIAQRCQNVRHSDASPLDRDDALRDAATALRHCARLASTPADAPSGEGLHLPWTADPDDRPGYEWNWHVLDAKGDRVCFMANGPDSEAKVRHLVATANTLRTAADPELAGAQEVDLLAQMAKHTNWELSFTEWDEELEDWQVHAINGGMNDREWTLIGSGSTPAEAIAAALAALPQPPADEVKS